MTRIGTTNNPQSIGGTAGEGIAGEGTAGDPARTIGGNAGEGARAPQRGGERLVPKQSAGHSFPIIGESQGEVSNECLETGAVWVANSPCLKGNQGLLAHETGAVGTAMEYLLQASASLIPTGYAAVRLPMKAIICHYCRTI